MKEYIEREVIIDEIVRLMRRYKKLDIVTVLDAIKLIPAAEVKEFEQIKMEAQIEIGKR